MAHKPKMSPLKHFYAEKPGDLLASQKHVVVLVLERFRNIVDKLLNPDDRSTPTTTSMHGSAVGAFRTEVSSDIQTNPWNTTDFLRPHQVFTVDGARGSGKTYVLLSIARAVKLLSDVWYGRSNETLPPDSWVVEINAFPPSQSERFQHLAMIARIIIPSDMERQECVMERIFDFMNKKIEAARKSYRKGNIDVNDLSLKNLDKLQKELRENIMPGWHFARETGREIIIRDAVDYNDYIKKFEDESHKAVEKIEIWRNFLGSFLDFFRTVTLFVFLDDSDVQPAIISDILHTSRMYLNHPRVVTVLAGNVRAMRDIMLQSAMQELAKSMGSLSTRNVATAREWRRVQRRAIEDFLEKVLPLSQRLFIGQSSSITGRSTSAASLPAVGSASEAKRIDFTTDDFTKIAEQSLEALCERMFEDLRDDFLHHKFRLATLKAAGHSDRPETVLPSLETPRRNLEDYVAWWLFWNWYKDALAPRSARQIATFRDYYVDGARRKRLIHALFENPANSPLIQQLRDSDTNVHRWLQDQELDSEWVGPRRFHINGRFLEHGGFAYDYVRFRLDVGIAAPTRLNAEEAVPLNLLPVPRGRTHIRRFFQPNSMQRRQRRIGVCRWIDHAVIPSNCIYFRDLDALPDRSLLKGQTSLLRTLRAEAIPPERARDLRVDPDETESSLRNQEDGGFAGLGQGHWEAWLAENWMNLIEDEQDEDTYRYFTGIVCASQRSMAGVKTSELLTLLDGPTMIREQTEGSYEDFLKTEFERHSNAIGFSIWRSTRDGTRDQPSEEFRRWGNWNPQIENVLGLKEYQWQNRMISRARYAALINDVRRAWHAVRVFDLAMGEPGRAVSLAAAGLGQEDERAAFAGLATQDRLKLYTADDIRNLFDSVPWSKEILAAFDPGNGDFKSKLHNFLRTLLGDKFREEVPDGKGPNSLELWRWYYAHFVPDAWVEDGNKTEENVCWTMKELCSAGTLFDHDYSEGLEARDEDTDYRRWVTTLRAIGRVCNPDWPDLGVADPNDRNDLAHGKTRRININLIAFISERSEFEKNLLPTGIGRFGPLAIHEDSKPNSAVNPVKSVRNFVFLLYGLAPSLSALLHSELMGIVWKSKVEGIGFLDTKQIVDAIADFTRKVEVARGFHTGSTSIASEQDWDQLDSVVDTLRRYSALTRYKEAARKTKCDVEAKIRDWANLIASLAMALRYVRAKYLQLHFMIWIDGVRETSDRYTDDDGFKQDTSRHLSAVKQALEKIFQGDQGHADLNGSTVLEIFDGIGGQFKMTGTRKERPNKKLSLMSDASSSSVFGERWFEDTIISLHNSKLLGEGIKRRVDRSGGGSSPDIMKADGIFAETEQWLWAANRCLRKFYHEFKSRCDRHQELVEGLEDVSEMAGNLERKHKKYRTDHGL